MDKNLCESILDLTLRRINRRRESWQLYSMWPSLHVASIRLCSFLSPYIEVDDRPLLDIALERGFDAAVTRLGREQLGAFIAEATSIADELSTLQISVQDKDGDWEIWDFDRPLLEWLGRSRRECLQIRPRQTPFPIPPLRLALLKQFAIRDLMQTQIDLTVSIA